MAEDTKVGSETSFTTKSANNLLLNVAENVEVDGRVM